jgi:alkylation response protein AidB-like acyl-CoA dehydrogenase
MNVMHSMPEEAIQLSLGETFPEIRDLVRRICSDFPGSYWRKLDDEEAYPTEFVAALTKAGLLAALIPEEYGGLGLPLSAAAATLEEIHACGCNAGACHAQMYIMGTLLRHGSAEQKQRICRNRRWKPIAGLSVTSRRPERIRKLGRALGAAAITTSSMDRRSGRRARCNRI